MLELLIVIGVLAVVAAMAIPTWQRMRQNARLNGDAHNMSSVLSVAKMRAAANFTESRVFFFTGTDATQYFRIDVWNKTLACWVPDGKSSPANTDCVNTTGTTNNETFLSTGVGAGFGSATTAPDGTSATAQASQCKQGQSLPTATDGSTISNTSCIQFNSRGFPTASAGFYITDGTRVYGVTTNAMGLIRSYATVTSSSSWKAY